MNDEQFLSRSEALQRQEEERARIAKDLESSAGQLLANAIVELAAVKQLIESGENATTIIEGVTTLQQELEQGLSDLRFYIAELEPNTILGNFGLVAGLRRYLEKFTRHTGIKTDLHVRATIEQLPNTIEVAIFRILQESLQNVRDHASAQAVKVTIAEQNGLLQFSVIDDGIGFVAAVSGQNKRRLGLVGMKEIANLLKGVLQVKSDKKQGTHVILTLPYPKF
ncbi:MAG: hypothetical protein B6242_08105 [Anaerolineaceae bacterium 4572_78]|nr:MAG: hypothetical protein B6242_08105 [Anaerolineaceae bacterium 4572_78]